MKTFNKLFILSALSASIFFGCSKNDGATGPAGPQGATGATGNANVLSVMDSANSPSMWTFSNGMWYTFFPNPNLSSTFINAGGFTEIFVSTDNRRTWTALPTNYIGSLLDAEWSYSYTSSSVTGVFIYFSWTDEAIHTDPFTTYGSTAIFNVVCIAPSIQVKYPGTNWSSYSAIQRIPELQVPHN